MFAALGTFVHRARYAVIVVMAAIFIALGIYGMDVGKHLSQGGWYDDTSESARASRLADEKFGKDTKSDVILVISASGSENTVDNPEISQRVFDHLSSLKHDHSAQTVNIISLWGLWDQAYPQQWPTAPQTAGSGYYDQVQSILRSSDGTHTFVSIGISGNDDTERVKNYRAVRDELTFQIPDATVETTGLLAVTDAINLTMDKDVARMEIIAVPLTALIMFFVFGGIVAAILPAIVGGFAILGGYGLIKILSQFTEISAFAQPVVSLVGLGIAVDYGLFIVSRFREELSEGYPTDIAVRRTVQSAGRTVVYSALLVVVSIACVLLFPQGFLRSVAYACAVSITFAAFISLTVLPAMLSIVGPRVDALSLDWILRFLRLNFIANLSIIRKFQRTRSREQVMDGFWGSLSAWVMRHPIKLMLPVLLALIALIYPALDIKFGGISEKYLPPTNSTRMGLSHFEEYFPSQRTEQLKLMVIGGDAEQRASIASQANAIPGFTGTFRFPNSPSEDPTHMTDGIAIAENSLIDRGTAGEAVDRLRHISAPDGVKLWVFGTPALEQDSINAVSAGMPAMGVCLIIITMVMMYLAFGSLVLPLKAVILSLLSLGSTLGVLTWIFQEGHGSELLNFTPYPLMAVVLALLIALVYGVSSDYEVFLLARTVEARGRGLSTTDATCEGAASGGRIITAAALVLLVVASAFGFSDLVMMKYLAFGLIAALIIDVTAVRMILVPATMKLLGDENWWAPRWMKRLQEKLGLGEIELPNERHLIPAPSTPTSSSPLVVAESVTPSEELVNTGPESVVWENSSPDWFEEAPTPPVLVNPVPEPNDTISTQPIYVIDDDAPIDQQEYWTTHQEPPPEQTPAVPSLSQWGAQWPPRAPDAPSLPDPVPDRDPVPELTKTPKAATRAGHIADDPVDQLTATTEAAAPPTDPNTKDSVTSEDPSRSESTPKKVASYAKVETAPATFEELDTWKPQRLAVSPPKTPLESETHTDPVTQTSHNPVIPEKPEDSAITTEERRAMSSGRHYPGAPGTMSPWDLLRKARGTDQSRD